MDNNWIVTLGLIVTLILGGYLFDSQEIKESGLNQAANNTHFCMKSENDYSLDIWDISEFDCERILAVCPHIPNLSPQMIVTGKSDIRGACKKDGDGR